MREKQVGRDDSLGTLGITPACAGKTVKMPIVAGFNRDHPRVCGKNNLDSRPRRGAVGSPPRVREKLRLVLRPYIMRRITPACAGKTTLWISAVTICQDHPRVCGKNFLITDFFRCRLGSPPRVREKPSGIIQSWLYGRITPACAGKTPFVFFQKFHIRDHPRVCGKNQPKANLSVN